MPNTKLVRIAPGWSRGCFGARLGEKRQHRLQVAGFEQSYYQAGGITLNNQEI